MFLFLLIVNFLFISSIFAAPPAVPKPPTVNQKTVNSTFSINTPLGKASGIVSANGVARFVVKYASAKRFQPSVPSATWISGVDPSAMPPVCLQAVNGLSGGPTGSEDCLYMVIYVPLNNNVISNGIPILTWIHGGSFMAGSASNPGLDGSAFAKATNTVVAVVQYRLGALGFLPPSEASSNSNLGAKDVGTALKFINNVITSFGGDKSHVTLAGQSSGATLVRGLLAAPSVAPYFQNAILHSDPMAYGFNTPAAQKNLQTAFYSNASCATTDSACHAALPTSTIVNLQSQIYNDAATIDVTTSGNEPIRIIHDGTFVTSTLTGNSFPSSLKPIILTTANKDAGPAIHTIFPDAIPGDFWDLVIQGTFLNEAPAVLDSSFYPAPPQDSSDIRPQLVDLGTDQIWRCPTWSLSRAWAAKGGTVYTGVFVEGSVYPDDVVYGICSETNVCHEGDIEILFGTVPGATAAQTKLITETQARWASFVRTSNPTPAGSSYTKWAKSTSGAVNALNLGGTGVAADTGCEVGFFGSQVQYYYQLYNQ